jgi:hypothetical protein
MHVETGLDGGSHGPHPIGKQGADGESRGHEGILQGVPSPMDPERKRKFLIFVAIAYGWLALVGIQLWLRFDGHLTASVLFGVVPLAGLTGTFWWGRRAGLFTRGNQK